MKRIMIVAVLGLLFALGVQAQTTPTPTGPFGFEQGMTPAQVIKLVGQPTKTEGDVMIFASAPKPNDGFEAYTLVFSPTAGLVKVAAIGKDIQTGDDGSQLQTAYHDVIQGVELKYGPHNSKLPIDFCSGNDTECSESQFWMMSLLDHNRVDEAFWGTQTTSYANGVSLALVEAKAEGINKGYILCGFEFAGYAAYSAAKKANQNSTF